MTQPPGTGKAPDSESAPDATSAQPAQTSVPQSGSAPSAPPEPPAPPPPPPQPPYSQQPHPQQQAYPPAQYPYSQPPGQYAGQPYPYPYPYPPQQPGYGQPGVYPQQGYAQPGVYYPPPYAYFNPRLWQPVPGYGSPIHVGWAGKTWGLLGLGFVNFLLNLVTLLFYRFWATNEIRTRLWHGVRFNGEPLAYRGTGLELFLGFIVVFLTLLVPIGLFSIMIALLTSQVWQIVIQLLIYVALLYLVGVGTFRSARYRLRRTSWRGIRGRLEGSSWTYGWIYLGTTVLFFFLLGFGGIFGMWIMPIRAIWLRKPIINQSTFGGQSVRFIPDAGGLYKHFAIAWCSSFGAFILALIIMLVIAGSSALMDVMPGTTKRSGVSISALQWALIGLAAFGWVVLTVIMYFYYQARQLNIFATSTYYDGGRFRGTATTFGLLWVWLGNQLIWLANILVFLIPLGIVAYFYSGSSEQTMRAFENNQNLQATVIFALLIFISIVSQVTRPVMLARSWAYFFNHLAFDGGIDLNKLTTSSEEADGKTGEGLAQAFDVDVF
ncbi:MAG: DUF898 domain-containing protein [Hyphomicrobiaceae bacterium]|nr:MAG: DUF898 domain-containing protein [Hyphomicrobiaceae bacterium]